ncbi:acetolactate decarboxylase [Paraburkholderia sp. GAS42]|uniref:acetolactate decarboxylase n=1 Tax=Paraburkholderia sp. GAS42 TaxID=3035135 RepID=UPI003D22FC21
MNHDEENSSGDPEVQAVNPDTEGLVSVESAHRTLFQVSTSGALVAGLYQGAVSAAVVLQHGDFGLGTFADLDGEMVVVDGRVFQARGDGTVNEVGADAKAPFAVVTKFAPDIDTELPPTSSLAELEDLCDTLRPSNNIFYAVRLDGVFTSIKTRAVSPPPENTRLVDAAKVQTEFEFANASGTLVGLWSPGFSSAFSIPGYHFHFLSDARDQGGHLLACSSERLHVRIEQLTDFHLALPSNEAYLKADLSKNSADELAYAEQAD